jgi:hypothetical protein
MMGKHRWWFRKDQHYVPPKEESVFADIPVITVAVTAVFVLLFLLGMLT